MTIFWLGIFFLFGGGVVLGDYLGSAWWLKTVYGIPVWGHFLAAAMVSSALGQWNFNIAASHVIDQLLRDREESETRGRR
jgi:hypothetical protein